MQSFEGFCVLASGWRQCKCQVGLSIWANWMYVDGPLGGIEWHDVPTHGVGYVVCVSHVPLSEILI